MGLWGRRSLGVELELELELDFELEPCWGLGSG
jgi:hypothetical protein